MLPRPLLRWLSRTLDVPPDALTAERMIGSTSSTLFRIRVVGRAEGYVLRLLDNAPWLAEEPNLAAHEATALREAARAGLPAPRAVAHADATDEHPPLVLMTLVEGAVDLRPADRAAWLRGMAGALAAIHRHPAEGFPWEYRSWVNVPGVRVPDWSARPELWTRAIERWRRGPPDVEPTFIHRDYHPANLLWRGGALSGIVDWINACRGPAGVDVAHCRTNLALLGGADEAAAFLDAYRAAAPAYHHDPYWELDSLLDMALHEPLFYAPWADFGLDPIPAGVLRARLDEHLERLMG